MYVNDLTYVLVDSQGNVEQLTQHVINIGSNFKLFCLNSGPSCCDHVNYSGIELPKDNSMLIAPLNCMEQH